MWPWVNRMVAYSVLKQIQRCCMNIVDLGNFITLCNMLIFYEERMLHNHEVAYSLIRSCVRCLGAHSLYPNPVDKTLWEYVWKVMGELKMKYQLLRHYTTLAKKYITGKIDYFYDWVSEICTNIEWIVYIRD